MRKRRKKKMSQGKFFDCPGRIKIKIGENFVLRKKLMTDC